MLVGVDFDNTIVCYDRLFHALAVERSLIPADLPRNKTAVRDYLRSIGREDDWTELQGIAYGPEIHRAEPFPGVLEFFQQCKRRGIATAVISHKTQYPYRGEKHDLHAAARRFLREHGFLDEPTTGLTDAKVFLELTKDAKLARIAALGCTLFIDDLPEFLGEPEFPSGVERVLFGNDPRWNSFQAWSQIWNLFGSPRPGTPGRGAGGATEAAERLARIEAEGGSPENAASEPDRNAVERLLSTANLPSSNFQLSPIPGGGNNRGYRLTTNDGNHYFLKWYFRHPDDPRDRLGTEFAFTRFCRRHGVDEVPLPYARDDAAGLGLYEFIEGRRLTSAEIDDAAIDAATSFFRRINEHRRADDAQSLPNASEACFSIKEHLDRIGARVERLVAAAADPDADAAFQRFVTKRLAPTWTDLRAVVASLSGDERRAMWEPIPGDARRLSPSDFGFHNALLAPDGRIRFIDLEYAGWDDPAKTCCDFFCQVQVPVPTQYFEVGLDRIAGDEARVRVERLLCAYMVKWCCIVLNVFLPVGASRRSFGAAPSDWSAERTAKLQLAGEMLDKFSIHR